MYIRVAFNSFSKYFLSYSLAPETHSEKLRKPFNGKFYCEFRKFLIPLCVCRLHVVSKFTPSILFQNRLLFVVVFSKTLRKTRVETRTNESQTATLFLFCLSISELSEHKFNFETMHFFWCKASKSCEPTTNSVSKILTFVMGHPKYWDEILG